MCRTSDAYIDLFNSYTSENITPSQLTEYDTRKVLPEKYSKLANDLWNIPELYKHAYPLTDSQQYVKRLLMDEDIELYVVSVSHPDVIKSKVDFIKREYPFINEDNIIFTHHKQLLDLDILVDDNYDNLINGKYRKLLFSYYWNLKYNAEYHGMVRVNNWSEIYDEVIRILEAKKLVAEMLD